MGNTSAPRHGPVVLLVEDGCRIALAATREAGRCCPRPAVPKCQEQAGHG